MARLAEVVCLLAAESVDDIRLTTIDPVSLDKIPLTSGPTTTNGYLMTTDPVSLDKIPLMSGPTTTNGYLMANRPNGSAEGGHGRVSPVEERHGVGATTGLRSMNETRLATALYAKSHPAEE
jgi:hypothetical protein